MKKSGEIALIVLIIVVMISGGLAFVLMGARAGNTHYVCVEVNPRVEFLTDNKRQVKSVKPLNEEAHQLLIEEEFVGISVVEATEKFVELCARAGYIDVNGKDNVVRISVLSGLNHSLEVDLSKAVLGYFVKNNIYGVVVDGKKDLSQYKQAKKEGLSVEKFDLVMAVKENGSDKSIKDLKKNSNRKLIELIEQQHKQYEFSFTNEQLQNKVKLIDFNRENYEKHVSGVTEKSTKSFREEYSKFLKKQGGKYEQNFEKTYENWLENR